MVKKLNDIYLDMRKVLKTLGVTNTALEARELCAFALKFPPWAFLQYAQNYVDAETENKLAALLSRRVSHEPLAYILGEWDFYSMSFFVTPGVLIPRPDTETLVTHALRLFPADAPRRILDLCCGTGCIGLSIANNTTRSTVVLADISEEALLCARRNISRHALTKRVYAASFDALSDADIGSLGKFDIILSNPPYIREDEFRTLDASVRDFEPRLALSGGTDGLLFYRAICKNFAPALNPGGTLIFECGFDQSESVALLLEQNGFCRIRIEPDLTGSMRMVSAYAPEEDDTYAQSVPQV